jgi:hypothetical protein
MTTTFPDERLLTGDAALDRLTDGGFPRGRMTEIVGPMNSGKTTLISTTIGSTARAGGKALVLDFDQSWRGVSMAGLTVIAPKDWREAGQQIVRTLYAGDTDLVVIDCLFKNMPGLPNDEPKALRAELSLFLAAALPRLSLLLRKNSPRTALVFLARSEGEWEPGGKPIKFYPHLRLHLLREGSGEVRVKVTKTNIGSQQGGEVLLAV